jgi:NADH-quinone oxidoreductase subunit L
VIVGGLGIIFAYVMYMWDLGLPERFKRTFPFLYRLFFNKWFFDEIYDRVFVQNTIKLGRIFWSGDKNVIDGLGPDGSAKVSQKIAGLLSRFQTGFIYQYAFVMMIALVGLFSWFFFGIGAKF